MSNFREMTPQRLRNGSRKNFRLLKYDHIMYHNRALSPTFGPKSQKFRKNRNDVFFAGNDIYEVKFAAEFKNRIYFVIRPLMTSL